VSLHHISLVMALAGPKNRVREPPCSHALLDPLLRTEIFCVTSMDASGAHQATSRNIRVGYHLM